MKEEIKRIKAQVKINELKWKKEVEDKIKDISNRIVVTIKEWKFRDFNDDELNTINECYKDRLLYDSLNTILTDYDYNKNTFSINTAKIEELSIDFTTTDFKIFIYIGAHIPICSNKFECNYDDLANYLHISTGAAYVAMNNFVSKYNGIILLKTTASKVFVINHNIILKGNYSVFSGLYACLYGNNCIEFNDKGKAIIK